MVAAPGPRMNACVLEKHLFFSFFFCRFLTFLSPLFLSPSSYSVAAPAAQKVSGNMGAKAVVGLLRTFVRPPPPSPLAEIENRLKKKRFSRIPCISFVAKERGRGKNRKNCMYGGDEGRKEERRSNQGLSNRRH